MASEIRIKPHHFIDILTAFGRGQTEFEPHPYGHAVHLVARQLLEHPDTTLIIELGADDVCKPCRHNKGGLCDDAIDTSFRPQAPTSKREWNLIIDRRWCARLNLSQGDRITARDFCARALRCVDDLTDIYREEPPERSIERAADLKAGIEKFLALPRGRD